MTQAIQSTKNSASGPDKIHNEMLKHLPPEELDSLLVLYNKIWQQRYFPKKELQPKKIPISTPGKDLTNPLNYRPITLISALCKVIEGMVNVRILDFFDQKGTLSTLQYGDRAKRTIIDKLLSLEATVRKTQANSEQLVSIVFDMEKAYDLTRKHGILMDIHEVGIEGRVFKFIQKFFTPRSFKVEVNEILSDTKVHTEGIPRGSVVSPTFFILKIKKIIAKMPNDNRFQISLYMDDLKISYRHSNWKVVQRKLQDSKNIVKKFAQKNGFDFYEKLSIPAPIELRLRKIKIEKFETVNYLGPVFDSKHDWKAYIQQLKSKCNKSLNLMRSVSSTKWGADQKT